MDRLLSLSFVFLLAAQCVLSMVIPEKAEEKNKREVPESEEVEMVAGKD